MEKQGGQASYLNLKHCLMSLSKVLRRILVSKETVVLHQWSSVVNTGLMT